MPPTWTGLPPALSISPTRVVVVVLPLLPVMATIGPSPACEASCIVSRLSLLKRDVALNRNLHERQLRRNPAAQAQQVTAVEQRQRMAAQRQLYWKTAKLGDLSAQLFGRRGIADRHVGAGSDEEARQGQALPGHTQNDDSFPTKYVVFH